MAAPWHSRHVKETGAWTLPAVPLLCAGEVVAIELLPSCLLLHKVQSLGLNPTLPWRNCLFHEVLVAGLAYCSQLWQGCAGGRHPGALLRLTASGTNLADMAWDVCQHIHW